MFIIFVTLTSDPAVKSLPVNTATVMNTFLLGMENRLIY